MKHQYVIFIILILGAVLVSGCIGQSVSTDNTKMTQPVRVEMSLLNAPEINKPVDLEVKIVKLSDFNTTGDIVKVDLRLPSGFEYINGDFDGSNMSAFDYPMETLLWKGSLSTTPKTLNAKIRAIDGGCWELRSDIVADVEGGRFGDADSLIVGVSETPGEIGNFECAQKVPSTSEQATSVE